MTKPLIEENMMAAPEASSNAPPLRNGVDRDGGVTIERQRFPFSTFASEAARRAFAERVAEGPATSDPLALRAHYDRFNDALAAEMRAKFKVEIVEETMGGVPVQRVIPRLGGAAAREDAILVSLHGGAFMWGAGSGALVEAIPMAAATNLHVIAVDYRLAPEHRFPAASEDACAVFLHLLKHYAPEKIGIYGLSAGAILTAQLMPWLQRRDIPLPGAIAMLGAAGMDFGGDSNSLSSAVMGEPAAQDARSILQSPYLQGTDANDPQVMPERDDSVLSRFPPSLLISGSRDFAASSVTQFHRRLAANGVDARLFMFDGLWHAFHIFGELPESDEAHRIMADFFQRELKLC